jgi:autotransporter-associated beta strand protein
LLATFFWSFVVVGLLCPATVQAAPMYWDTSTDAGIQPGDGTWDNSTAAWSASTAGSDPLLQWVPTNDAHFHASGTSAVSVGSGVGANKVVFDGTGYALSGSTLTVGAGGIVANESATINNALSLNTNQSVYVAGGETLALGASVSIGSNVTWTKQGEGTVDAGTHRFNVSASRGYTHEEGELIVREAYGVYVTGGATGNAVLTQRGGTITSTGLYFIIGGSGGPTDGLGHKAIFNMEGGALNATGSGSFYCGWNSDTVINQSGGTINANRFGSATDNGHGWYNLSGGSLNIAGQADLGHKAGLSTEFTQTGGSASFATLTIGGSGSADYTISTADGPATLTVGTGGIYLGRLGAGEGAFHVEGGTVQVNGDFRIATSAGTTGTVTQTGGTVTIADSYSLQFGPGTAAYHLDGGTLKLANLSFTDAAKNLLAFGGGTLEKSGGSALTTAIPVEMKAGGGTIHTPGAALHLSGSFTGEGNLTKTGGAMLTLSGVTSDFTGDVAIGGGTLQISVAGAGSVHLTGAFSGTGALSKIGDGLLTLSGASSGYTGPTTVSAGTLRNEGALGGGVTVNAGATLEMAGGTIGGSVNVHGTATGTGTISGTTDIRAGAELIPGTGGGALSTARLNVGSSTGTGTLTMNEGVLNVGGYFILGAAGIGSTGVLNISGGQINASGNVMYLGHTGNATVNQTGGVVNVTHSGGIHVCTDVDGLAGTYNLDGGTLKTREINTSYAGPTTTMLLSFGGGTLENNGTALLSTAIPVEFKTAGGTIHTPGGGANIRLTGPITGDGAMIKTGPGVLTLTGTASDYTGALTVEAGTLLNQTTTGGTAVVNGGTLQNQGTITGGALVNGGVLQNQGTIGTSATVNASGTLQMGGGTVSGPVHAHGLVTGTGTISGTTDMYAGAELRPGTGGGSLIAGRINVGRSPTGTATVTMSEGTLQSSLFILGAGENGVHSTGVLNISGGQLNTPHFYLGWKGNGIVNQTGGTVNVTGSQGIHVATDYEYLEGTYNLDGGTLKTRAINTTFAHSTTTMLLSFGGGTLENNGTALLSTAIPVEFKTAGGTIYTPGGGGDIRLTGTISGSGALRKTGGGLLTLSGSAGGYSGALTVEAGTLLNQATTAGTAVVNGGTLQNQGTIGGSATVNAAGTLQMTGGTVSGPVLAYGLLTGTGTISGTTDMYAGSELRPGSGGGSLIAGRINVGSSSTGTATVNMSEGTLQSSLFILGAGQNGVHSTGVLNISGGQLNTPHFYLGWRGNGIVNQTGGTVNVTGTAGIHVATDYNGLEGTYNLDGGTLRTREIDTTAGGATNRSMLLSFGGGTLENNGTALLSTAIPVEFKAGGGTIHTPGGGANIRLTGPITGGGALTKTGPGVLTLTGTANGYTGAVNVDAGTLLVNTSLAGTSGVNVASGATLGGNGTIGGPTSIQAVGTLSTGGSIGTLAFLDDLTLANGAIWDWEFIDTGSYDQAIGDDGARLILPDAGTTPAITLNILGDQGGHWVDWYDEFVIFDGQVDGFDAGLFNLVNNSDWERGWRIFSEGGQNLILTAVPEPGTLGMLAAAFLGLLAAGHQRRK